MKLPSLLQHRSVGKDGAWAQFQEERRKAALDQMMVNRASRRAHGLYIPIPKVRVSGAMLLPRYIRRHTGLLLASTKYRRVRKQQARILRIAQKRGLA